MKTRAKEKLDIHRVRLARRFGPLDADLLLCRPAVFLRVQNEQGANCAATHCGSLSLVLFIVDCSCRETSARGTGDGTRLNNPLLPASCPAL